MTFEQAITSFYLHDKFTLSFLRFFIAGRLSSVSCVQYRYRELKRGQRVEERKESCRWDKEPNRGQRAIEVIERRRGDKYQRGNIGL
jgi:hypothetical protein